MLQMTLEEIMREVKNRREPGKAVISNYYPGTLDRQETCDVCMGEKTVVFWHSAEGITRVYFFSTERNELIPLLRETPEKSVIDYIGKEGTVPQNEFEAACFRPYATYCKRECMYKGDMPSENPVERMLYDMYQPDCGTYAEESDVDSLLELMFRVFDPVADHLYTREKLLELIQKREVLIYKIQDTIESFAIHERTGKRLYAAFSYNNVSADILYSLERRIREEARKEHGIEVIYAWMNVENKKALRRSSLADTGIRDYIFVKQGEKE